MRPSRIVFAPSLSVGARPGKSAIELAGPTADAQARVQLVEQLKLGDGNFQESVGKIHTPGLAGAPNKSRIERPSALRLPSTASSAEFALASHLAIA